MNWQTVCESVVVNISVRSVISQNFQHFIRPNYGQLSGKMFQNLTFTFKIIGQAAHLKFHRFGCLEICKMSEVAGDSYIFNGNIIISKF